jgi:hypothetical protein
MEYTVLLQPGHPFLALDDPTPACTRAVQETRLLRGKGKAPGLLLREPHTLAPHGHREHHHISQLLAECWPRPHDERTPE